jgi:hypothetical protein
LVSFLQGFLKYSIKNVWIFSCWLIFYQKFSCGYCDEMNGERDSFEDDVHVTTRCPWPFR